MIQKIGIILLVLLSGFSVFASDQGYDRKQCDKKVGVENYIHAGKLDDESFGGKTYNFVKIVSDLENEVLGKSEPRADRFSCLDSLFEKAKLDASQYWKQRLQDTSCAGPNGLPDVKPEGCEQNLWDKFNQNMNYIDSMASRKAALNSKCKLGNNKCNDVAGLGETQNMASQMSATQMDRCCDTENGPAFRVLRTTYTYEFSKSSNAEVQRACYKMTRPNQENGFVSWSAAGGCLGSVIKGIFDSMNKLQKSVASLFDLGMLAEVARVLGKAMVSSEGRQQLMATIGTFLQEVEKQVFSQGYATTFCFTGEYQAAQTCRLIASLFTDYIAGGKIFGLVTKLIASVGKPLAVVARNAAQWVAETPAAQALKKKMTSISDGAKNIKTKTQVASSTYSSMAREAAAQLVSRMKPYSSIRKMVNQGLRDAQKEAKAVRTAERSAGTSGPNGQTSVPVPKPEPAPAAATNLASNSADVGSSSSAAVAVRKLPPDLIQTETSVKSIVSKSSKYNATKAPPDNIFGELDLPKRALKTTPAEKLSAIEKTAEAAREKVRSLKAAGRYSETEAKRALDSIDGLHDKLITKYGGKKPTAVASAEGSGPQLAQNAPAGAQGEPFPHSAPGPRLSEGSPVGTQREFFPHEPTVPAPKPLAAAEPAPSGGIKAEAPSPAPTVTPIKIPSYDLETTLNSAKKMTKDTQNSWNRLSNFYMKAEKEAGNAAPNMRSAVFEGKGTWSITKDAIRRHADVENLYRNGLIDAEKAKGFHNIIEVTEQNARNATSAYSQTYLNPSRTAAIATKLYTVAKPVVAASTGVAFSQYRSATNMKALDDPRYDSDTVKSAFQATDALSADPRAVAKKFDGLKTEEEILAAADEMRVKAKTVESYLKNFGRDEDKAAIKALLRQITDERQKALARLERADSDGVKVQDGSTAEAVTTGTKETQDSSARDSSSNVPADRKKLQQERSKPQPNPAAKPKEANSRDAEPAADATQPAPSGTAVLGGD